MKFYAYAAIIASGLLYINTLIAIKKIVNKEDAGGQIFLGFCLVCFIVFSLILVLS